MWKEWSTFSNERESRKEGKKRNSVRGAMNFYAVS